MVGLVLEATVVLKRKKGWGVVGESEGGDAYCMYSTQMMRCRCPPFFPSSLPSSLLPFRKLSGCECCLRRLTHFLGMYSPRLHLTPLSRIDADEAAACGIEIFRVDCCAC